MVEINNDWQEFFNIETQKEYYINLRNFLIEEYANYSIMPVKEDIFKAFQNCPVASVKAVILGQDPYPTKGNATGYAFSVPPYRAIPGSLRNIYKEIESDIGTIPPFTGNLDRWVEQGVFLLNTVLTVREGQSNSHAGKGWEQFTDAAIKYLNDHESPKVFILWGNNAKNKEVLITNPNHLVLKGVHPSPLSASRGFFGCKHFSKANEFLASKGVSEIGW